MLRGHRLCAGVFLERKINRIIIRHCIGCCKTWPNIYHFKIKTFVRARAYLINWECTRCSSAAICRTLALLKNSRDTSSWTALTWSCAATKRGEPSSECRETLSSMWDRWRSWGMIRLMQRWFIKVTPIPKPKLFSLQYANEDVNRTPKGNMGQRYPLPCIAWLWIGVRGSRAAAPKDTKSCRT